MISFYEVYMHNIRLTALNSCHGSIVYIIRKYGSTLYVGMALKQNGRPYISIGTNELKSLLIYTDEFKYTHTF